MAARTLRKLTRPEILHYNLFAAMLAGKFKCHFALPTTRGDLFVSQLALSCILPIKKTAKDAKFELHQ